MSSKGKKDKISAVTGHQASSPCESNDEQIKNSDLNEINWRSVLIEGSRDGIVVLDESGKVYDINKKFAEHLNYPEKELFGLHVWDWDEYIDKDRIIEMIKDVDEKGNRFQTRHRRKDGTLVDMDICTNAAVLDGKKLIFCVCRDISKRINTEKALRNSEARMAALSDASFESIFLSEKGICLDQNLTAQRMFGYTRQEALGQPGTNWIVTEDREAVKINILSGYEKPYEVTALRKDGGTFPAEIQGRMIEYDGRQVRVTALRDITDRKKAQTEKMEAVTAAAENEKLALVGQVAGKMAHDFNNILGIIMGTAELSLMNCQDPMMKESLEIILEQTIRGKNLTRNLVAFAKDQEPKQEYIQINEKIELVLTLLKKDLERIEVFREYGRQEFELLADPGMVEHALVNIFLNSIHATGLVEKPEIIVKSYQQNNKIFLKIEDNGCGIPDEYIEKIYEPSFTLKGSKDRTRSYKPEIKGTGYGLANVKKYIEKHKGQINIKSKMGKGTEVTIQLPLIKKNLTRKEIEIISSNPSCHHGRYILLVEDEQALSDIQYKILTQPPCRHRVDIASKGRIAKDLFDRNTYDFVSLDYILPGEFNGIDVYYHIRKKNKMVPILFISGNIEFLESVENLKKNDPMMDHISKPCKNIDYLNCINRLMDIMV